MKIIAYLPLVSCLHCLQIETSKPFTTLVIGFTFFAGQQYCWSDTASCISETASTTILPNHLRSTDITSKTRPTSGNLETASAVVRKSYNNLKTTHYGLIDWPSPKAVLATSNEKREVFLKNWINGAGLLSPHTFYAL